jgi:hypothetical protein
LQASHTARGARYLPQPGLSKLEGWLTTENSDVAYHILPSLAGEKGAIQLSIRVPEATSLRTYLSDVSPGIQSVVLWDKWSGQAHWLIRTVSSTTSSPVTLDLPGGTWTFELWSGQTAEVENRLGRALAKTGLVESLSLRPFGKGHGLWQLAIPSHLGYASWSLQALDATGRRLWSLHLPPQGVGRHKVPLPSVPVHAWVQAQSLDGIRARAVSRGALP